MFNKRSPRDTLGKLSSLHTLFLENKAQIKRTNNTQRVSQVSPPKIRSRLHDPAKMKIDPKSHTPSCTKPFNYSGFGGFTIISSICPTPWIDCYTRGLSPNNNFARTLTYTPVWRDTVLAVVKQLAQEHTGLQMKYSRMEPRTQGTLSLCMAKNTSDLS